MGAINQAGHRGESTGQDGIQNLRRRAAAIIGLFLGTLLLMMDSSIVNVGLPTIAHDLHVPGPDAVLLVVVYNLALAMTLLPLATLGMIIGLRRLFLAGLSLYLIAALLSWFAHSLPVLLFMRTVQALGAAAALSVSSALVRSTYPRHLLGRGLGINTLAAAVGGAVAPVIGGFIVARVSWHWVFLAGAPLACISLLTGRYLPDPDTTAHPFDKIGASLCAATFGLLIFGLRCGTSVSNPAIPAVLLCAGAVTGFFLIRYERSHPQPVLPVDLFRRPALSLSVAAAFCGYFASTSIILALPFRLHSAGFSPTEIGEVILPYALAATIFGPTAGVLSDRFSPTTLGTIGLGIAIIALLLLAHLPATPLDVAGPMALLGTGFGLFVAPNGRLIIGSAAPGRAASASSLISTNRMMGQALGSTFVAALLTWGIWPSAPLAAAALTTLAFGLSLARRWVKPDDNPPASR